jgi:AAA+ superfamily predicted ATPase
VDEKTVQKAQNMPIFQDHFLDNRNEWELRDDDYALLRIDPGDYAYVVHHKQQHGEWTTWQPFFIDDDWSYKIHAVIERVSGGNFGYGLIWRCQDEENCYSFEISQSGYFRIRRRSSGVWSVRQPWTQSRHIQPGQQAVNELMIIQLLDKAEFFINGEAVFALPFTKPSEDDGFGFVVNGNLNIRVHSTIVLRYVDWTAQLVDEKQRPSSLAIDQAALDEMLADLNQLVGMENIKQEINTLINFLKVQKLRQTRGLIPMPLSLHMVLAGPPGTGKTTVARLIGRIYRALSFLPSGHLIETDRAGLVAPFVGQTAIKVDEMVEKALGGILFIDEAYALMPRGSQNGHDFGLEAIETLLKRMEDHRGRLAVIIAGYGDELHRFLEANPGVKSRFNRYFYFEHYKPYELANIFTVFCTEHDLQLTQEARKKLLHHMTAVYHKRTRVFGNGRYARNLLEKTIERQANRIVNLEPITDELLCTLTETDIPTEPLADTAV